MSSNYVLNLTHNLPPSQSRNDRQLTSEHLDVCRPLLYPTERNAEVPLVQTVPVRAITGAIQWSVYCLTSPADKEQVPVLVNHSQP